MYDYWQDQPSSSINFFLCAHKEILLCAQRCKAFAIQRLMHCTQIVVLSLEEQQTSLAARPPFHYGCRLREDLVCCVLQM